MQAAETPAEQEPEGNGREGSVLGLYVGIAWACVGFPETHILV